MFGKKKNKNVGYPASTDTILICFFFFTCTYMGNSRRLISSFFFFFLSNGVYKVYEYQIVYPMDDDKNKGFKGSFKASPGAHRKPRPFLYKLNCRIHVCRLSSTRNVLNRYLVTHFIIVVSEKNLKKLNLKFH